MNHSYFFLICIGFALICPSWSVLFDFNEGNCVAADPNYNASNPGAGPRCNWTDVNVWTGANHFPGYPQFYIYLAFLSSIRFYFIFGEYLFLFLFLNCSEIEEPNITVSLQYTTTPVTGSFDTPLNLYADGSPSIDSLAVGTQSQGPVHLLLVDYDNFQVSGKVEIGGMGTITLARNTDMSDVSMMGGAALNIESGGIIVIAQNSKNDENNNHNNNHHHVLSEWVPTGSEYEYD